ncbi:MAG TPA: NUDIX domain-containing protein [Fimbriimonas sp.]|nr:NUDIX domain-containing protein [Fimbriimonas sp.]
MLPQVQRIGCYALLTRDRQVLLCRLSHLANHPGFWTLPGGGMEFGEHPEETMRREVWEETGFEVKNPKLLAIYTAVHELPEVTMQNLEMIYSAEICGGELCHEAEGTTDLCAWLPIEQARTEKLVGLVERALSLVM